MSRAGQVRCLIEKVLDRFGKIDILFNNAGIARGGPLVTMEDKAIEDLMQVHGINRGLAERIYGSFH